MSPLRGGAVTAGNGGWQHDKHDWGMPVPAPQSPLRRNSPVASPWGRRTFNPDRAGREISAGYAPDCATVQGERAESPRARQHHHGAVPQHATGRWLAGLRPAGEEVI